MNKPREQGSSGKSLAVLASAVGLALVWSAVWANLPSWEELQSARARSPIAPEVPDLDLTIPGIPPRTVDAPSRLGREGKGTTGVPASKAVSGNLTARTMRAEQVAEVKCAAEVQETCPDALTQEERHQCLERRAGNLSAPCQTIAHKRMMQWKELEGYKTACAEDVKRVCRGVDAEDGNLLACLQTREQDLSFGCYQSLPKGRVQLQH
jgi:hypothetical protein